MKQNKLDEMQEQALLKIEHNGCWFAFWGLLVMMAAEALLGFGVKAIAGEWIIFMALALYLCVDCIRHGIWDRHLKASGKTNLIASLVAAVSVGFFSGLMANRYADEILDYLLPGSFPQCLHSSCALLPYPLAWHCTKSAETNWSRNKERENRVCILKTHTLFSQ